MSIITDYLTYQQKFESQYGAKTVVLYQIGSFYECYQYDPSCCLTEEAKIDKTGKVWDTNIGHAVTLSIILNCELTYENKNKPYSIKNPNKLGFPCIVYEKNLKTLLANDYAVVRMDQSLDANNNIIRIVSEIVSPTMSFNNISPNVTNVNIIALYIEYIKSKNINKFDVYLVTSGIAVFNIITGESIVSEFYSKEEDEAFCSQEIYRFLLAHNPKELIIHIDDLPQSTNHSLYLKYINNILDLNQFDRVIIKINELNSEYKKINYQIEFLNKLFNNTIINNTTTITNNTNITNNTTITNNTINSSNSGDGVSNSGDIGVVSSKNYKIIDELNLTRLSYARIAYLILIQYCYENNGPINNIKPPVVNYIDQDKFLILSHNTALTLEVINNHKTTNKINSLFAVMDKTCTYLGRRALEYMLLHPMSNNKDISTYYDMVDKLLTIKINNEPLWLVVEKHLKGLPDIARLQRKIELSLITPKDFTLLIHSYGKIIELLQLITNINCYLLNENLFNHFDVNVLTQFVNTIKNNINIEILDLCYIDTSNTQKRFMVFDKNPFITNNDIITKFNKFNVAMEKIEQIDNHLKTFIKKGGLKNNEKKFNKKGKITKGQVKQDYTVTLITTSSSNANKIIASSYNRELCGELTIAPFNTTDKVITSTLIEELCYSKDQIKEQLKFLLLEEFEMLIKMIINEYKFFTPLCHLIAKLDVLHCYAKLTFKNKYFRPTLINHNDSIVKIKDLRHPIIEKIIDHEYITNNITIGKKYNGLLLYGINACGKSAFLKAIGLIVIMAQAGCYVPGHLTLSTYKYIFSRLSNQDNMFSGESSFEVEMKELRTALRQSNNYSLILADEIGRSTETRSAISITVVAMNTFADRRSSFIFSSHLHEIADLPFIPSNVRICHLSVEHDLKLDTLVYDRKLKDGSGTSHYGLSVIKYLNFPPSFINEANKVALHLEQLNNEFLTTKKSHFNPTVYMDKCSICKSNLNLQTHHIKEQHLADNQHYINYMHKNTKDNLFVVCEKCHKNIEGKLTIQQTINGNIITKNL